MLKMIGVVMIIGSCSAIGISMSNALRERMAALKSFIAALQILKAEIVFRALPIPQILHRIEEECSGPAAGFFSVTAQVMQKENTGFHPAAERQLESLKRCNLKKGDIRHIAEALHALGRYDAGAQAQALTAAEVSLQQELDDVRKEAAQKGKLYQAVGLTTGIMLALVML